MKPRVILFVASCALALTGCNLAPVYRVPAVKTPVSYKEAGDWLPANPADVVSRGPWWTLYGDRTLNDLEAEIDSGSPTLAAAAAAYEQARSLAAEAEAGLYPSIDLGGEVSANKQSADRPLRGAGEPTYFGANTVDVEAGYEIDLWGRVRNAVAAGREQAQASAADLASLHLVLQAELASDYVGLRGLDDESQLLTDTVTAYTQADQLTRNMFEDQIASRMDVTRAQAQLYDAQAQLSDITARRALLEHAIAELIGEPPAALTILPSTERIAVPDVPLQLPSTLLQRRPDIAAAERRVAASNESIGIARSAFFPDISLGAAFGFQGTSMGFVNAPDDIWAIGPDMILPLFEGGLRRAKLQAARAAFEEAADRYRATALSAFREVEDNLALLHWLKAEGLEEQQAATAAQQTLDLSMGLYRNGANSYLDVVTAQTTALTAERAVLALQTRRVQASIGLIRALGGGWSASAAAAPVAARIQPQRTLAAQTSPVEP